MKIVYRSNTSCEYTDTLIPVFKSEVMDNLKWYDNGSPEAIWEYISPLSKTLPLDIPEQYTTPESTSEGDSSASSRSYNYTIISQILALSMSIKLLLNIT